MKSVCLFVLLLALVLVSDLSVAQGRSVCPPCCRPLCQSLNWKELSRRCRWTFRLDSERQFRAEVRDVVIIIFINYLLFSVISYLLLLLVTYYCYYF